MTIAAHPHPQAPGLPPLGDGSAQPPSQPLGAAGPFAGLLAVVALALAASLVLVQTRPAEFKTPAAPTSAAQSASPAPPVSARAAAFTPPDLHPTPPRVPALAGARPSGPPPLSFALPRQGPPHHAPLPPSPGAASLKGVYGTQKACAQCGWVESVQSLSVGSGGLPPRAPLQAQARVTMAMPPLPPVLCWGPASVHAPGSPASNRPTRSISAWKTAASACLNCPSPCPWARPWWWRGACRAWRPIAGLLPAPARGLVQALVWGLARRAAARPTAPAADDGRGRSMGLRALRTPGPGTARSSGSAAQAPGSATRRTALRPGRQRTPCPPARSSRIGRPSLGGRPARARGAPTRPGQSHGRAAGCRLPPGCCPGDRPS